MKHKTITAADYIKTIAWLNESIIDWAKAGNLYSIGTQSEQLGQYHYVYGFDGSVISKGGEYAFIYQKLGTKGLLLKNGDLLREINRSYYCANAYEYPAAFITLGGVTYLVHCPIEYCRLDFEDVETGEIITDIPDRDPQDFFHSRLEISPSSKFLMSKGWVWHPLDDVFIFDIEECLKNPLLLDEPKLHHNSPTEICTASFISDAKVLIGSSDEVINDEAEHFPPKHVAVWDIVTNEISTPVKVDGEFGNLFAINEELAWDTFEYPKIININTGKVLEKLESVNSGKQRSSIVNKESLVQLIFNPKTKQIAILNGSNIEVLAP
ncbi:hypothetical protein [Mucilaginibacter celer]|uniref:WD40 repeat domain-containing protein n=1 Tax=Mucilaginibacter celer TaxID=2305508 RepID=A0A494VR78_9SPHI|nr:hypothetical protein [Mucilaginibacter celer]AYL97404.1 hypothetical protein HYN43_019765 [Mucilaginibacter celer]